MTHTRTKTWSLLPGLGLLAIVTAGCGYDFTVLAGDGGASDGGASDGAAPDGSTLCGNGELDIGEDCDSVVLNDSCEDLGFAGGGDLSCASNCTFDTSECHLGGCGNGALDVGEECDTVNLGGANCVTLGWTAGTLACTPQCTYDTSLCTEWCDPFGENPCPASSISDDFEDGVQAAIWGASFTTGGSSYAEDQGFLILTLPTTSEGYAAYLTDAVYQLSTYDITVEHISFSTSNENAECSFEVKDADSDDVAGISLSDSQLSFFSYINLSQNVVTTTPLQTMHRYWRLGSTGGNFYAETSHDGATWTQLGSMPNPFQMERVQIAIKAGIWQIFTSLDNAIFDNFNLLP